jgi:steroid delta-isomerase-like uncharacterized protein
MVHRFISVTVVAVFLFSFFISANADDKEDANMALMKRFYTEVINKGNIDLLDELCAESFVDHEESPGFAPDREGVKKWFRMLRTAFPDLKFEVGFMLAKDDKVVSYVTMTGTQKGPFMDMPASGKKIRVNTIDIVSFANGKAVEHWGVTDSGTMMQQLGAIPEEPATK